MSELFTTVLADPGWRYNDTLRMSATKRSSIDQYKTTMTVEEICARYTPSRVEHQPMLGGLAGKPHDLVVPGRLFHFDLAADGFLWLWTTNSMLLDGSATTVCRAWGYEPKQIITWIKVNDRTDRLVVQRGMGRYTRGATEHVVLATRGKAASMVRSHSESNVIFAPRLKHSQKPAVVYDLIERVCPGPYLELFARGGREGWTSYGDELGTQEATTSAAAPPAPAPIPMHTMLIVDEGAVTEHHDVLPDDGLAGQWPE